MRNNSNIDDLRKIRKGLGIDPTKKRTTGQRKRDMLAALQARLGIVSPAAKVADVGRMTHYEWIDENSPTFDLEYKKAVDDIMEMQVDFGESALFKNIQAGKEISTIFYLRCKGKKRGYIQGEEIRVGGISGEALDLGISDKIADKVLHELYKNNPGTGGAPGAGRPPTGG